MILEWIWITRYWISHVYFSVVSYIGIILENFQRHCKEGFLYYREKDQSIYARFIYSLKTTFKGLTM